MKIFIFGVSGLIGNSIFKFLSSNHQYDVHGTCRNKSNRLYFAKALQTKIITNVDISNKKLVKNLLISHLPNIIINCIGITKHSPISLDYSSVISTNTLWPHELAKISSEINAKLIQISTDCVFSGDKGCYTECDFPDAKDLYGQSKLLGEVTYENHLTVRISTIGHELYSSFGLMNWFLSQQYSCRGYSKAIFSGLPASFFGKILDEYILPRVDLRGLYHVSSSPIDKLSLLKLIAIEYKKQISIVPDESIVLNRSLDGKKFSIETGFICPSWPKLINFMAIHRGININV